MKRLCEVGDIISSEMFEGTYNAGEKFLCVKGPSRVSRWVVVYAKAQGGKDRFGHGFGGYYVRIMPLYLDSYEISQDKTGLRFNQSESYTNKVLMSEIRLLEEVKIVRETVARKEEVVWEGET